MATPLERAISLAAVDISDALGNRNRSVTAFLEAALWSATTMAEGLAKSEWVDPNADDGWLRGAAEERYELPDNLSDKQFRDLTELLHLGKDMLEKSLPARLRMEPELESEVNRILGKQNRPQLPPSDVPPLAAPKVTPPPPEPKLKPEDAENIQNPPVREQEIKRDNVKAPDDEFDDSIVDKPGLPGDPRLKK